MAEKNDWLAMKSQMESKFQSDLAQRDAALGRRENEHVKKLDEVAAAHNTAMAQAKDAHDAAMAARLAEMHAAQAKFDADLE